MKNLIFLFLFFTTMALSQNFTIRQLTGKTTSDVAGSDIWLISNSAGALKKITYTVLMANLDDEAFTWTAAHTFSGIVTLGTIAGGVTTTGSWTHDGAETFTNTVQFNGTLKNFSFNSTGTFLISGNAAGFSVVAPTTFSDELVTFNDSTDHLVGSHTMFAGAVNNPTGADIAPTATWDASDLPQVVVVLVNADVTVTSITNGSDGQILHIIGGAEQGDFVTIQDNSTINLRGDEDFIFNEQWCSLTLVYTDQNTNEWTEISRSHSSKEDFKNVDVNGTLGVTGISTFDNNIVLNDEMVYAPEELSLLSGLSALAITKSFIVLDGHASTSTVTDFTGLKSEGQKLTVMCLAADGDGFVILDGSNIICAGSSNITMTGGDVAEFIFMDGKWYNTSQFANNN